MSVLRPLVLAVLPLFAGCQMLNLFSAPAPAPVSEQRIQGEISQKNGQLILTPCAERATYQLLSEPNGMLTEQAKRLLADTPAPLFGDLRGTCGSPGSIACRLRGRAAVIAISDTC